MNNKKNTKKEETKLEPKNKRLIDRNSIFHFLFGRIFFIFPSFDLNFLNLLTYTLSLFINLNSYRIL